MTLVDGLKQNHAREMVLTRIRSGEYRPGQRLPSERELAQDLDLSHITVRRGLQELVDAGLIVRRPRIGTFVQETRSMELSNRVALVLPACICDTDDVHPLMTILMRGVMSGLDQRDCAISLISYNFEQFWHDVGEVMLARDINGALIYADNDIPYDQVRKLAESGIKTVMLNASGLWPEFQFSAVSIDAMTLFREALQRIIDLGHRKIAYLGYGVTRYRVLEEQLIAGLAARHRLPNADRIVHLMPADPRDYYSSIVSLLSGEDRPTAILMQDEMTAHEVFKACHRLKLDVPKDLSLVAINDNTPRAHVVPLSAPDTTGLWIDATRRAATHLRQMMTRDDSKQIEVVLHANIQWKESTAAPASAGQP